MPKVFIGVGHGGTDSGATANGLIEKNVNLVMALAMKLELERHGVEVGISRTTDATTGLTKEISLCNTYAPDLAVECHNNAGGGKGFEVFRQTNNFAMKSATLAKAIEAQVIAIDQNSRGVKTKLNSSGADYFGWCRQVNCPSVLCEGAFLDNTADAALISTEAKQQAFGAAYAKGVLEYLGIAWKPPATTSLTPEAYVQVFAGSRAGAEAYAEKIRKLSIDGTPIPAIAKEWK